MLTSEQRGRYSVLAGEQDTTFHFGGAAPNAVGFTNTQGVVETGRLDVAKLADGFRPSFTASFVVARLDVRWGEEDTLKGSFTRSFPLPFERDVLYFRHVAPPYSTR